MSLQILQNRVCQHRPKLNKLQASQRQPKQFNTKAFSFRSSHGFNRNGSSDTHSCTYHYIHMLIGRRFQNQSQRTRPNIHNRVLRRRRISSAGGTRYNTTSTKSSVNSINKTRINHEPPLHIRIALVSTSKNKYIE